MRLLRCTSSSALTSRSVKISRCAFPAQYTPCSSLRACRPPSCQLPPIAKLCTKTGGHSKRNRQAYSRNHDPAQLKTILGDRWWRISGNAARPAPGAAGEKRHADRGRSWPGWRRICVAPRRRCLGPPLPCDLALRHLSPIALGRTWVGTRASMEESTDRVLCRLTVAFNVERD